MDGWMDGWMDERKEGRKEEMNGGGGGGDRLERKEGEKEEEEASINRTSSSKHTPDYNETNVSLLIFLLGNKLKSFTIMLILKRRFWECH